MFIIFSLFITFSSTGEWDWTSESPVSVKTKDTEKDLYVMRIHTYNVVVEKFHVLTCVIKRKLYYIKSVV